MNDRTDQLHIVKLEELVPAPQGTTSSAVLAGQLGVFSNVKTKVTATVGTAQASVGEMLALKAGEVLTLDRSVDAPIDLWVEGEIVARGQLSVVGDKFAVLITEVSPAGTK